MLLLAESCCLLACRALAKCQIPAKPAELPSLLLLPRANVLLGLWALFPPVPLPRSEASIRCHLFQVFTHHFQTPCMCHLLPPTPDHLLQDPQPPQLPQLGWAQGCQVSETGGLPGSGCKRALGGLGHWGHSVGWGSCCCRSSKSFWSIIWDSRVWGELLSSALHSLWSALASLQLSWTALSSNPACCNCC